MRAFIQLRQMLSTNEDLKRKIEQMESKYDEQFRIVLRVCLKERLASDLAYQY